MQERAWLWSLEHRLEFSQSVNTYVLLAPVPSLELLWNLEYSTCLLYISMEIYYLLSSNQFSFRNYNSPT